MVKNILTKGKNLILSPQTSILSAATIIMIMIIASRILGLARQRVLANFFSPNDLSLFFAAFRIPDLIFEVLVFGTFSSAFIPVFTKALKKNERIAWNIASTVINIGIVIFFVFAFLFVIFAQSIYRVITPGFTPDQISRVSEIAKILFIAQGFFVISYVLTGVLESMKHFLVPALAPIFYNLGIILATSVLAGKLGTSAPAIGVVIGAILHLCIQLPLAIKLGYRFNLSFRPNKEVKEVGRLAAPRLLDLGFAQILETFQLSLATIISTASFAYFTFANSLQLLPVGLFGTSLAKAAMPTLTSQEDNKKLFASTFLGTLYQMFFMIMPLATILIVLRLPLVRLAFGTSIFDWRATVQTGWVLTAFGLSIPFQAAVALLNRAFYALHDTKTSVIVSIISDAITIIGDIILVLILKLPVWSVAASYSFGIIIQVIMLFLILARRIEITNLFKALLPTIKTAFASIISGVIMYFLLKLFDIYIFDSRYTLDLLILTTLVTAVGLGTYALISFVLRSQELLALIKVASRQVKFFAPQKTEEESIIPPASENIN
jgi:putative peptidoglycan lipid II flippase